MVFPCEIITKKILPGLRAMLTLKLINEYSMTQEEVANILCVSQASVSFYLSGLRAKSLLKEKWVEREIERIAETVAKGESIDIGPELCKICRSLCAKEFGSSKRY